MQDQGTIVLYVLSTLAQTAAALAGFVGAVGIFRLQVIRDRRRESEEDMRRLVAHPAVYGPEVAERMPLEHIVDRIEQAVVQADIPLASLASRKLETWRGLRDRLTRSTQGLVVFEAWNLVVIGASLVGFNYVPALATSSLLTFWALWVAALGTVAVTGYCVFAWTRG